LQSVGANIAGIGAAIGGPLVGAVKVAADFNQELANIASVGGKAAQESMQQISDTALQLGKDTAFSASQAAQGMEEMVKAGIPIADVLNGAAASALNLSAATGTSVPESATLMSTALNVFSDSMVGFNTEGDKATEIANLFAQAANASATDVHDLGAAFNQSALVAKQFNIPVQDLTAQLGLFANAGLQGSDAGTSFKTMLISMLAPTKAQSEMMNQLGISYFDAQGKFIGLDGVAAELRSTMGGLTEEQRNTALAVLFGTDAVRAASIMYDQGGGAIAGFTGQMNAAGTVQEQAATRLNTFEGALETFRGSVETLAIQIGTIFLPVLVDIVHGLTTVVNAFISANPQIQQFVAIFGGIGAILLTATGGALLAAGHILRLVQVLNFAGISVKTLAASLGLLGIAIGAGILAYQTNFLGFADAVNGALSAVMSIVDRFTTVFDRAFNTRQTRGLSAFAATVGAIGRAIRQAFGLNLSDQFNALGHAIDAMAASFQNALDAGLNPVVAALGALSRGFAVLGLSGVADAFDRSAEAVKKFGNVFGAVFNDATAHGASGFTAAIQAFGQAISAVTGVDVSGFFTKLAGAVDTFGTTFQRATDRGVNPLEAAFIALRRSLGELLNIDLRGFTDVLGSIAGGIRDIGLAVAHGDFVSAADVLGNLAATLGAAVAGLAVDLVDWTLNVAAPTLIGWVTTAVTWLSGQIGPLVSGIPAALGEVTNWLLNVGLPTLGGWVGVATSWIAEHLGTVVAGVVGIAEDFAGWVLNVGVPTLAGWVNIAAAWIGDQLRPVAEAVAGVAVDFAGWVLNVGIPTLAGWINIAASWLHDTLTGIVQAATGVAADFADWVVNVAAPTLAGWVSIAASWLHDTLTGIVSGVAGVAADFTDWIVTVAAPTLAGWVNVAGTWLHDTLMGIVSGVTGVAADFANWVVTVAAPTLAGWINAAGPWLQTTLTGIVSGVAGIAADFSDWVITVGVPTLAGWVNIAGPWIHDNLLPVIAGIPQITEDFQSWTITVAAPAIEVTKLDLQKSLHDAIQPALDGLDATNLLDIATLSSKVGAAMRTALTTVNDAIVNAFLALMDPDTAEAVVNALHAVGLAIGASVVGFATGFVLGKEVDFHQIGDQIRERLQSAIDAVGQAFSGFSEVGLGGINGPGLLQGLSDQLFKSFQQAAVDIAARLTQIDWSAIPEAIKNGIGDALANFGTQLFGASTAEAASADAGGFDSAAAGKQFGDQFVQAFQDPAFIAAVKTSIESIPTAAFADVGTGLMQKISDAITASLSAPASDSGSGSAGGAGLGATLITNIVAGMTSAASTANFSGFGATFASSAGAAIGQGTAALIAAAQAVVTTVIDAASVAAEAASAVGTALDTAIGPAIGASAGLVVQAAQGLVGVVVSASSAAAATASTVGGAFDTAMGGGIGASAGTAISAAQAVVASAIAAAQSAGAGAFDAGFAIGEGLARGMQAALTDVQAAASQLAAAAESAVKQTAQIASPSKVSFGLGTQWGQGFIDGINKQVASAGLASQSMATSAAQALSTQTSTWADFVAGQSHNERLSLRRAREAGQLTAQHRSDLMAGGNIADFINDTSRAQPPQIINTTCKVTMDGREMGDFVVSAKHWRHDASAPSRRASQ
jgi:TP901 family phage tail tape measure protein